MTIDGPAGHVRAAYTSLDAALSELDPEDSLRALRAHAAFKEAQRIAQEGLELLEGDLDG